MSLFKVYNDALNKGVKGAYENTLIASIVLVVAFLYTDQLRPTMPAKYNYIFTSSPVRLITLTIALSIINRNPPISFLLVSTVIIASHYASAMESFELLDPSVLLVDPNCEDVTYEDLLKVYDGDAQALESFARTAGLAYPRTVKNSAPIVASLMMQSDIPITTKCSSVYNNQSALDTIN